MSRPGSGVLRQSFLTHAKFLHLKLAVGLSLAAVVAYVLHDPIGRPGGGTWLGYTLGGIGAAIILLLLWYGVRKRRFHSSTGTVRGWLSAHVYLGLALIVVGTLHSGFQFGWNIHTLAWALMLGVILSGIYGIYAYRRYPALMTSDREAAGREMQLQELADLDEQAITLAADINDQTHQVVVRSIQHDPVGGGLWTQLRGGPPQRKRSVRRQAQETLTNMSETVVADLEELRKREVARTVDTESTMKFFAGNLADSESDQSSRQLRELMDIMTRRRNLARELNRDIQQRALLQIWLYFHVPLSIALLAALAAHIVAVFAYW